MANTETDDEHFRRRLLKWAASKGRKNLPWQINKTSYRVWVSEIMLQQTQANTVIPYFESFIARFPSVAELAASSLDEVLECWAGLGYYRRAQNLHRAAKIIRRKHAGELPQNFEALHALPGIGRTTAGAIMALCHEQPFPILDGNVKRVLARQHNISAWPGQADAAKKLWRLSQRLLPHRHVADYTQGLMDLGAVICLRTNPRCGSCPVTKTCQARAAGTVDQCPGKPPFRKKARRSTVMLMITRGRSILLKRRPRNGVWGGLLCPPEISCVEKAEAWCLEELRTSARISVLPVVRHTFTHFKLDITPVHADLPLSRGCIMEETSHLWYKIHEPLAVPAPVKRLLKNLDTGRKLP